MTRRFGRFPFNPEARKWYRRITSVQMSLGLLAILFIFYLNHRDGPSYEEIALHDYDDSLVTQGLEADGRGRLLVSSGDYGESRVGYLDQGEFVAKLELPDGEIPSGLTLSPPGIWLLTRQEGKAYLLDPDSFAIKKTVSFQGEGWGLAYDPGRDLLYMSDGSATIQVREPENFELVDSFLVESFSDIEVSMLDELEYDGDHLYANIFLVDAIVRIDVGNHSRGRASKRWDLSPLVEEIQGQDPLSNGTNGIAHKEGQIFYIAGKRFPQLYELELE